MNRVLAHLFVLSLAGTVLIPVAAATPAPTPINVGFISYDLSTPPGAAQFDIVNLSGPNSSAFPDTTFPVSTAVSLASLSLDVSFATGPDEIFGASYFTLSPDGLSFDGTALSTGIGQPSGLAGANKAVLTGSFSTTSFLLNDGTTVTVDPSFTATIQDALGLSDGDNGLITANGSSSGGGGGGGTGSPVPEPGTFTLLGTGLAGLASLRRKVCLAAARKFFARAPRLGGASAAFTLPSLTLAALLFAAPFAAHAVPVKLTTWTAPSAGATGSTYVNITGTGFPAGTFNPALTTISLSTTCGGPGAVTTVASSITNITGTADRVRFLIPALLATGDYFVSISGNTSSAPFTSSNCSEVRVQHTSTALAACLPSSSLAVLSGKNVTAYVPLGNWGSSTTGVKVVPIEGTATAATIATPAPVNSCSSNSQTGQTVCVGNNTDVYEITGSTLNTTLQSGSDRNASFSGGSCKNCGVAINALTNTAVITMGLSGGASNDGVQLLNLANNTLAAPFPTDALVSENASVDPNRNLILSPGEGNIYDLFKVSATGALTEYENQVSASGEMDSAAEDCTTGIALSTLEFTGDLYIGDLTQAAFVAPLSGSTHGTWSAPGQVVHFPEFASFSAGTDGISVAAGTTHLGIVAGEFGGNTFGAFQLPATSGTGTPAFVDYVAATMPTTPDGNSYSSGFDPHTITAYTSPNNGKAYGLLADWFTGEPTYVGIVDLQALLSAPRTAGTHTVDPTYDLLAHNVVRYVAVP